MLLQVQEFFGDFVVLDSQHFCIPLPRPHVVLQPFSWDYANSTDAVTRMTEGLASLTLSLRRRFNIRSAHVPFACTFTVLRNSHLIQHPGPGVVLCMLIHSDFDELPPLQCLACWCVLQVNTKRILTILQSPGDCKKPIHKPLLPMGCQSA